MGKFFVEIVHFKGHFVLNPDSNKEFIMLRSFFTLDMIKEREGLSDFVKYALKIFVLK